MKSWTVLPFGRQSFLDAHLLQGSGLSNWLGLCFGCCVGHLSTRQLKELGFAIAWASAWDAMWAGNNRIFNSFR